MNLLEVENLRVERPHGRGSVALVDGVSLRVAPGECVGVVGESGSGKSLTVLSIMRLLRPPLRLAGGSVRFGGRDLLALPEREMRHVRGGEMAIIFQEPSAYLSPVHSIGQQIVEVLRLHRGLTGSAARNRAVELLDRVRFPSPEVRLRDYAHQLSGGMCQRAMIALALAGEPRLLIADEPTTALDVTIQAQILAELHALQREAGMSLLLVTHDLAVVSRVCDRVVVMYAGQVVEEGPVASVFAAPLHPYTRGLLASVPRLRGAIGPLTGIPGSIPAPGRMPSGCRFAPRCPMALQACTAGVPVLEEAGPDRRVRCIRSGEPVGEGGQSDGVA